MEGLAQVFWLPERRGGAILKPGTEITSKNVGQLAGKSFLLSQDFGTITTILRMYHPAGNVDYLDIWGNWRLSDLSAENNARMIKILSANLRIGHMLGDRSYLVEIFE